MAAGRDRRLGGVSAFIRAFHLRREGKREERSSKSIQNEIGWNEPGQQISNRHLQRTQMRRG